MILFNLNNTCLVNFVVISSGQPCPVYLKFRLNPSIRPHLIVLGLLLLKRQSPTKVFCAAADLNMKTWPGNPNKQLHRSQGELMRISGIGCDCVKRKWCWEYKQTKNPKKSLNSNPGNTGICKCHSSFNNSNNNKKAHTYRKTQKKCSFSFRRLFRSIKQNALGARVSTDLQIPNSSVAKP